MESVSIAGHKLEAFKVCANDVIHFKLVRREEDIADDEACPPFKPEMTHQIFGESETIFGYKDLRINMYYTACKMLTYVGIDYSEKINPKKFDGVQADDIVNLLDEKLEPGYFTSLDAFTSALQKDEEFVPFGELIHQYNVNKSGDPASSSTTYEIRYISEMAPKFEAFHARIQPFLLFFIDAASYIDVDDPKWSFYVIYEKYNSLRTGDPIHSFVGYMTVYNYYAYPDKIRPRISQVLILPPFQGKGHCSTLVQTFYKRCWSDKSILDVAVEDPSDDFQRIRDFTDSLNCSKLTSYQPHYLTAGFSKEMVTEAREKLKLSKRQARRVYEILRLKHTNCFNDEEFKAFRIDIKKRLNAPFQKSKRHFDRMCRLLRPNELAATLNNINPEVRLDLIEKQFQSLVNEYRHIVDKLGLLDE
ncbi:hypothetical protein HELRODRAFT_184879 [Helobdella robusta]|uniref:Histone acetyltransferase type B catalytic subunit n=1 Tax=Helobdella robusta TaxID=6412 RepID=T1FM44_HELRO|nr:hypothetical protein HELRODRAFT_184879 [Helobdella robusta]ESO13193.1 hypothetical protein HELRODRAFT_184879 [Helobdella robusta]